jgi:hypothetical protein
MNAPPDHKVEALVTRHRTRRDLPRPGLCKPTNQLPAKRWSNSGRWLPAGHRITFAGAYEQFSSD